MPSLPDTAVIILLGLLLFGPKGLAQIARQLGKLMGEFRRASNEFRMQMEEELRISEQADRQKAISSIEPAAPVAPALPSTPSAEYTVDHPHLPPAMPPEAAEASPIDGASSAPLPIASSGELSIMPPATGLPEPRSASNSSISNLIDSVPKVDAPGAAHDPPATNGNVAISHSAHANGKDLEEQQRPLRYDQLAPGGSGSPAAAEETLHG